MKVGVLGFGHVAAATIESFMANQKLISSKTRSQIQFVRVATRTPVRAEGRVPEGCIVSSDCWGLVDDPQVDVVLELTGDVPLGRQLVRRALSNHKHVVTANKALLAKHGEEIMALADQVSRSVLFEGAVAVAIPIVKTLRESAAANRISSITGILNGTSNYVLSQMSGHGADFAAALAVAQRKGYAEADPTLDISGEDAAHKLTLLASLGFGVPIDFSAVSFKGIRDVDRLDTAYAKRLGYQIKLIAQAVMRPKGLDVRVQPMLVPVASMLAQVNDSMNGIVLSGDLLGSSFLYGSGAGGRQTASAVLADLVELANREVVRSAGGAYNMGFHHDHRKAEIDCQTRDRVDAAYIRIRFDCGASTPASVIDALARVDVLVKVLMQDESCQDQSDLIVITHKINSKQLNKMMSNLEEATGVDHPSAVYPVLAPD